MLKLFFCVDLALELLIKALKVALNSVQELMMLVKQVLNLVVLVDKLHVLLLLCGQLVRQIELKDARDVECRLLFTEIVRCVALEKESRPLSHLFFGSGEVFEVRAHLCDLKRVDVNIGDLHHLFVVDGILGSEGQVVLLPVPVDAALVVALPVEDVVAVFDVSQDLAFVDRDANASPHALLHINLTVVVVAQT